MSIDRDYDEFVLKGTFWVIILSVILLVLLVLIKLSGGAGPYYSVGERTGTLVKFSRKGLIWKSWEGTINLGGVDQDQKGNAVPTVWDFSVTDPAVAEQLQTAVRGGERVTVLYQQWFIKPAQVDTSYRVEKVLTLETKP